MQMHNGLSDILATKSRLAVLRTLVRFPRKEFTGRELARLSHVALAQTQEALSGLRLAGIVERRSVGRSHQWRVVEDNILWPELRDLFRAERSMLPALLDDIRNGMPDGSTLRASIFGSVARGQERADSDIDLYLEVEDDAGLRRVETALEKLVPRIGRKFGARLNPVVVTRSRRKNLNPNLLRDVEENGLRLVPEPTGPP
jgi:predicted nucleotidyltransferase